MKVQIDRQIDENKQAIRVLGCTTRWYYNNVSKEEWDEEKAEGKGLRYVYKYKRGKLRRETCSRVESWNIKLYPGRCITEKNAPPVASR